MLTPAYKLTLGNRLVDTTDEPQASTVVELTVSLDLDTPADSLTLVLGNADGLKPVCDDQAQVELGYADNGGLTQVLSGAVVTVEPNLTTTRVTAHSAAGALLRTVVNQTYESKTAGAIVRDLAGQAGVDVATAEDGITFPAYVVDARRGVYHHLRELADLCGFDLYIDPDGGLVFEPFVNGKQVHVFEYAKHILALDVERRPLAAARIEAWGESPGGSQGDESWAWLTRDFSGFKGTAGSGTPLRLLERPALRTRNAAHSAAAAAFTAVQRQTLRGWLLILGRPEIKLGDAIRLSNLPDAALNANYQVRRITHRLSKRGGFTTTVGFRAIQV
jgi:phage protein D